MNQQPATTTDTVSDWAEGRLQQEPQEAAVSKAFPCPLCEASFDTAMQRQGHMSGKHRRRNRGRTDRGTQLANKRLYNARMRARNIAKGLTSGGKPRKRPYLPPKGNTAIPPLPHYRSPEYKRKIYLRMKRRNLARGLTARGDKPRISARGLSNIQAAQRARRRREFLNGASATPTPEQQPPPQLDIAGAAEQIVQCARTLVNLATISRIP